MMDKDEKDIVLFGSMTAVILLIAFFVLLAIGELYWNRMASPYAEETRAQTYDKSRAYNQGTNRDLARYCREYHMADGVAKIAVADLIRTTADTYQGALSPSNQTCLLEIGQ